MENEDDQTLLDYEREEDDYVPDELEKMADRQRIEHVVDPFEELEYWTDQVELDRWEVEYVPTDREHSLASHKLQELVACRLHDRRGGMQRSCGPCYRRKNPNGTQFKGRRGANKRAVANRHRRVDIGRVRP